jgi:hypothetical protein
MSEKKKIAAIDDRVTALEGRLPAAKKPTRKPRPGKPLVLSEIQAENRKKRGR